MNILQFLNYLIFNKDQQRSVVWNEFKKHFDELQTKRWENFRNRMKESEEDLQVEN
jgi:hypothetical protein